MNHVAIDLGGRESQVCIRSPRGEIIEEKRVATRRLESLMKALPPSRLILETSAEAFRIAGEALSAGHEVRVVPATLVKTLGVGARGIKTDRRDAQVLSEVSCRIDLPSVHIPSPFSRELKSLCGAREMLVETRTKLINNVRGWMRTQLLRIRSGSSATFAPRLREHAEKTGQTLPLHVERQLKVIEVVVAHVKEADRQLQRLACEHPICRRLMTVPGVGPVTAVWFLAALDQVARFPSAHRVQSYLGLTPGENSSSDRQQRTGITKAGSTQMRRMLIQAAWTALRYAPNQPMVAWATQVAARRGKWIAVVALARKMAGILFALWRDGTTYRPSVAAQPSLT